MRLRFPPWRRGDRKGAAETQPPAQPKPPGLDLVGLEESAIKSKWIDLPFVEVPHRGKTMRFATTGSSSRKRVRSLFSKEPITIAWIDSFAERETLFDVGANLGMYTIYAAVMRSAKVFAFEPEALNFAELNKNVFLNGLHRDVLAYCVAASDVDKVDRLLLSDFGIGISFHDFEEDSWTGDKQFSPDWHVRRDDRRAQGSVGFRLDSLIAGGLPVPDHVKIDVDGLEHRVVHGMLETLRQAELKTVLVEINFDNAENLKIIDWMAELGWRFSWDQLRTHRKVKFTVEEIKSYQRRGEGGLNYIFYKDEFYDDFFADLFAGYTPGKAIDTDALLRGRKRS